MKAAATKAPAVHGRRSTTAVICGVCEGQRLYTTDGSVCGCGPMKRRGDWICTASGQQFWPLDARPEEVHVGDIAHALANVCRFNGHTREFYSVAQHSVYVSALVTGPIDLPATLPRQTVVAGLWGLLHDAAEAYLCDLPRPVKRSIGLEGYAEAENALMIVIAQHFGIPFPIPAEVKTADDMMLRAEARDLMPPESVRTWSLPDVEPWEKTVKPMAPPAARNFFLQCFRTLQQAARVETTPTVLR